MQTSHRHLVVEQAVREGEVHPTAVFDEFAAAAMDVAASVRTQQSDFRDFDASLGGGAEAGRAEPAFEKDGYRYVRRLKCFSLFATPRPSRAQMTQYLTTSAAARVRHSAQYREGTKLWNMQLARDRALLTGSLLVKGPKEGIVVDVESRSPAFIDLLQDQTSSTVMLVEPLISADEVSAYSASVGGSLSDMPSQSARLVCAFDAIEHQVDPLQFVRDIARILKPGGHVVMTARSGTGFDIQVLGAHSSIFPLEHLNLLSPEGMGELIVNAGLQPLEISTPGHLDVQIVERVLSTTPVDQMSGFWRYVLKFRDEYDKEKLQTFLQQLRLSSHMRVIARKPL